MRERGHARRRRTHRVFLQLIAPAAVYQTLPQLLLHPAHGGRAPHVAARSAARGRVAPVVLARFGQLHVDRILQRGLLRHGALAPAGLLTECRPLVRTPSRRPPLGRYVAAPRHRSRARCMTRNVSGNRKFLPGFSRIATQQHRCAWRAWSARPRCAALACSGRGGASARGQMGENLRAICRHQPRRRSGGGEAGGGGCAETL